MTNKILIFKGYNEEEALSKMDRYLSLHKEYKISTFTIEPGYNFCRIFVRTELVKPIKIEE